MLPGEQALFFPVKSDYLQRGHGKHNTGPGDEPRLLAHADKPVK